MKIPLLLAFLGLASPGFAQNTAQLQAEVALLRTTVAALQRQVTLIAQNPALQLGPFVSVDPNPENYVTGPNIVFTGANIHIVSGSGNTYDNLRSTGLGNLIIGYNQGIVRKGYSIVAGDRGGCHNLVIGDYNKFTIPAWGCIVSGSFNEMSGGQSAIIGGSSNILSATSLCSVMLGGNYNFCNGLFEVVAGGQGNVTNGQNTVLLGGYDGTDGQIPMNGAQFGVVPPQQ